MASKNCNDFSGLYMSFLFLFIILLTIFFSLYIFHKELSIKAEYETEISELSLGHRLCFTHLTMCTQGWDLGQMTTMRHSVLQLSCMPSLAQVNSRSFTHSWQRRLNKGTSPTVSGISFRFASLYTWGINVNLF